jgi:DNA adenine methylase
MKVSPMPKSKTDYSTPLENDFDKIKWPVKAPFGFFGAKIRISKKIIEHIPPHNCWVELFCGSAALTMAKEPALIEIINDVDDRIINFFEQLRKKPKKLCESIALTPYARAEYENYFKDEHKIGKFEKARRFLVANMMAINATPATSSGFSYSQSYARQGREARVNRWYNLPDRMEQVVERLRSVRVEKRDGIELLAMFRYRPATLVYLDPPYFMKRWHSYEIDANNDEQFHIDLLKLCRKSKCMLLISGYDNDLYNDYLTAGRGWEKIIIKASTKVTTGKQYSRAEVLWKNAKAVKALETGKVPIRLTEYEKKDKKINPERKYVAQK